MSNLQMNPGTEGFFGGFYVRRFEHQPQAPHRGHVHNIDHVGNLVSGHVVVHWVEGKEYGTIDMQAPCKIHMPKGRHHTIEAVVPSIWECWFSEAEADRVYGTGATKNNYMLET